MKKLEELQEKIDKLEKVLIFCTNSFDDNVRINIAKAGLAMDDLINDPNPFVRRAIVDNGYNLERFLFDSDPMVREGVANQGYGLDYLVHDKNFKVRKAVAKSKNAKREHISLLAEDEDPLIRLEIAKQGKRLSELIKDPSPMVRIEVANQGFRLGTLAKDPNPIVRAAVASKGYSIKTLINDEDDNVRKVAKLYGFQHDDAIGEWKVRKVKRVCSICGHRENKYKVATKRCPKCNFIMENFDKLPILHDPRKNKKLK